MERFDFQYIREDELKENDCILMIGTPKVISHFKPYTGPIDFVSRIAVFADGSSMSLAKEHYYRKCSFARANGTFQ